MASYSLHDFEKNLICSELLLIDFSHGVNAQKCSLKSHVLMPINQSVIEKCDKKNIYVLC